MCQGFLNKVFLLSIYIISENGTAVLCLWSKCNWFWQLILGAKPTIINHISQLASLFSSNIPQSCGQEFLSTFGVRQGSKGGGKKVRRWVNRGIKPFRESLADNSVSKFGFVKYLQPF